MVKLWIPLLFLLLLPQLQPASSIPLGEFYDFGGEAGDMSLGPNDDSFFGPIRPGFSFPLFGANHSTIYVNNNGLVSFGTAMRSFTPQAFPLRGGGPLVAPFWADADTRNGRGNVWFRDASSNSSLLKRAQNEIRAAFPSQNIQPSFLFIATWERVGFFGGATSARSNTFQCILISDGRLSFTLFLYADGLIQWTTAATSGGVDGLGGTAAQVGFDAGDGIRFASVPSSQTGDIINIALGSNVGRAGAWAFRVDQREITVSNCSNTATLQSAPRLGNVLGGTPIFLRGPCFAPDDDIVCMFDRTYRVEGVFVSADMAICVSPPLSSEGWKDLSMTLWSGLQMRYSGEARFYAVSFEDSADIGIEQLEDGPVPTQEPSPASLHYTSGSRARVTWDPASVLPMAARDSYRVDVVLSQMDLTMGEFRQSGRIVVSTGEVNDGSANVTFPMMGALDGDVIENGSGQRTLPVVLGVEVTRLFPAPSDGGEIPLTPGITPLLPVSVTPGLVGAVQRWSPVLYFSNGDASALRAACERWRAEQADDDVDARVLSSLPPCPRTVEQARAPNSGFREDGGVASTLSRNFFHPGSASCFRQTTGFRLSQQAGQQCCYYGDGTLATGSPTGGTADLVSPDISFSRHFSADIQPFLACCSTLAPNCEAFYEFRPSDTAERFLPPPPAFVYGDPHIVTLDGFKYTFNGRGEFVLIATPGNQFTMQARMETPNSAVPATVITAIVAMETGSDAVQIELTPDRESLELLVAGEPVDFFVLSEQEFVGVAVTDLGGSGRSLSARFSGGAYVEARVQNGFISTVFVSLSRDEYGNRTGGLLGNYNGVTGDDLMPRGGRDGSQIPLTSSLEDIHNRFGVTWILGSPEESLFTYREGTSFSTFHAPTFTPSFVPTFSSPQAEAQARTTCGDDPFCLFDVAATNSTALGLATLAGGIEFQSIVNISRPVSCSPACDNGVCYADNRCSCSPGYQGALCSEPIFSMCPTNPCQNGGSCRIRAGSYLCSCPLGYIGIHCQNEVVSPAPGGSGSGSGILPICTCRREVECSIAATYNTEGTTVTPIGSSLRCSIVDSPSDSDLLEPGSGFGVSSIVIDNTFDLNLISVGSYSFLRAIGVFRGSDGVTSCRLEDSLLERRSILETFSNTTEIAFTYQQDNGIFDSLTFNVNTITQMEDDFVLGRELNEEQQCSLQTLRNWLSRPPATSSASFTCLRPQAADNQNTILAFRVLCE